jgi:hypothetical protein
MPTIREKISQLSTLQAPVTIRQALNSAPPVSSFLGGDKDINLENTMEINLSNTLTSDIDDSQEAVMNFNTQTIIIDTIETEVC